MIQEGEILPFTVSDLPEGPWLIFAPHADDETFGMGGSLALAKQQGIKVDLVIMTDGALGGDQENLVDIRKREATKAAGFFGIHKLTFLGEPDRALQVSEPLVQKLQAMILDSQATTVFFPGVMEPHPDHRATALLVWDALRTIAETNRPQPVAYDITVQSPCNCLIDITSVMDKKQQALGFYYSQIEQNTYTEIIKALNKTRTFTVPAAIQYAESFFKYNVQDVGTSLNNLLLARVKEYLKS